jgi:hypothetical protein
VSSALKTEVQKCWLAPTRLHGVINQNTRFRVYFCLNVVEITFFHCRNDFIIQEQNNIKKKENLGIINNFLVSICTFLATAEFFFFHNFTFAMNMFGPQHAIRHIYIIM